MPPETTPHGVIVSISSDIGTAMADRWLARGWQVTGTLRTSSSAVEDLGARGVGLVECDLARVDSVKAATTRIALGEAWDVLALCPGTMEPIGTFAETDFEEWARSIEINFTAQLRLLHGLLPYRRESSLGPCVLLMAGGGTNGSPVRYSAYTASKIALIKMCELLDAELADIRIAIVGPGWVRTKIHQETLAAGRRAGTNYARTMEMLENGHFTSMEAVLDCCDWIIRSPREVVGGRNFSVAYDQWACPELETALAQDANLYKLRRFGNDQLTTISRGR